MSRQPTPAEYIASSIGKSIVALSLAVDGTANQLTAAHSELCSVVKAAPTGPDRHWLACEAIMCAMREATLGGKKAGGAFLIACEEAREAITVVYA